MQIVYAPPELARAVKTIIVSGMAAHLIANAVNVRDDAAVVSALTLAGFGRDSVGILRFCAANVAGGHLSAGKKVH